ncbi:MAG: tripartite tricarboxylate transporter TctB family protein [Deltaproteobacteria bacterium]|nr:tripartite tricarboxylate transporter TctB family protein [Deltaproteobacteria bacterium]
MQRRAVSVISGVLIFVSVIYVYGILQIQDRDYTSNEISPTTFPWLLVALLVVLAISLFMQQWFGPARRKERVIEGGGIVDRRIIAAVFLLFLYIVGLQSIGFLWTTPVFLGLLSTLYDTRRLPLIAGMAVITTFTLYVLLKHVFGVPIP